jgi:hypothetical protein
MCLASVAVLAQYDAGTPPSTVKDVMTTMTIPASDMVFAAASDPPDDETEWAALEKSARTLADSGRLLMTPGLARDTGMWMDRAGALVKEAEAVQRLATGRNRDALEAAGDRVYATCETCHEHYLSAP